MSKLVFSSLTMLLILCVPALAQSAPAESQYDPGSCDSGNEMCAQGVVDGVEGFADNAGQGTDAVNDAMDDDVEASASSEAVLSAETDASTENASPPAAGKAEAGGEGQGLDSITELPETGGPPLAALVSGVSLVALGLMSRKVAGR